MERDFFSIERGVISSPKKHRLVVPIGDLATSLGSTNISKMADCLRCWVHGMFGFPSALFGRRRRNSKPASADLEEEDSTSISVLTDTEDQDFTQLEDPLPAVAASTTQLQACVSTTTPSLEWVMVEEGASSKPACEHLLVYAQIEDNVLEMPQTEGVPSSKSLGSGESKTQEVVSSKPLGRDECKTLPSNEGVSSLSTPCEVGGQSLIAAETVHSSLCQSQPPMVSVFVRPNEAKEVDEENSGHPNSVESVASPAEATTSMCIQPEFLVDTSTCTYDVCLPCYEHEVKISEATKGNASGLILAPADSLSGSFSSS